MTGNGALSGQRILVVEDDYYLATDTARAIEDAGAQVLGPYPTEEAAGKAVERVTPSVAVVDINLGLGPSFALARTLKERGVPLVFITGYDDDVIPPDLAAAPVIQKPVQMRQVVGLLARVARVVS